MSDVLSFAQEAGQYTNYQDYLQQQRQQAKDLIAQGAETVAEGSPLLVDTFRNTAKLIETGKKFANALARAREQVSATAEKAGAKVEEVGQKIQGKVSEVQAKAEGLLEKGGPKEVEMKTLRTSLPEDVGTKRPTTFTPASEEQQSKSLADYLRQKADARLENRVRSRMAQEAEADPENIAFRIQANETRAKSIADTAQQFNPETKSYEAISKLGVPESFEEVGKQAISEGSEALKAGTEGIGQATEAASRVAETATRAATEAVSAGKEALQTGLAAAKEGAEAVGKEAAATVADVALEAVPVVGEVVGTGALLYQGIKDLISGSRPAAVVQSAAPVFTPSIANPL